MLNRTQKQRIKQSTGRERRGSRVRSLNSETCGGNGCMPPDRQPQDQIMFPDAVVFGFAKFILRSSFPFYTFFSYVGRDGTVRDTAFRFWRTRMRLLDTAIFVTSPLLEPCSQKLSGGFVFGCQSRPTDTGWARQGTVGEAGECGVFTPHVDLDVCANPSGPSPPKFCISRHVGGPFQNQGRLAASRPRPACSECARRELSSEKCHSTV